MMVRAVMERRTWRLSGTHEVQASVKETDDAATCLKVAPTAFVVREEKRERGFLDGKGGQIKQIKAKSNTLGPD